MLMTDDTRLAHLVGHNIRLARGNAGLSQASLGSLIGQDRREVSRWERGQYQPSEHNLRRLAEALGHAVPWFFGEHDA